MTKPWHALTADTATRVGGYMGVYELADDGGEVIRIGYAGGQSRLGLGGELNGHVGAAASFRYEVTTAYMSRYLELLMVHWHDHGRLPAGNDEDPSRLGRLHPA
jgi:hypothetical protein